MSRIPFVMWTTGLVLVCSSVLFAESTSLGMPAWLRALLAEIRAACRDPGTQWMVFACCAIYFVTFTILFKRGARNTIQLLSFSGFQRLLRSSDFWLCGLLLIASLHYAFNYDTASGSTQALMLMAGAAIGKGARLWATWRSAERRTQNAEHAAKPETCNLKLETLLSVLLLLLGISSLWHPETAMQFQYRGLNRWSGPWDNPNIFGLLMGTGVIIGMGLLVASCRLKVAGSRPFGVPALAGPSNEPQLPADRLKPGLQAADHGEPGPPTMGAHRERERDQDPSPGETPPSPHPIGRGQGEGLVRCWVRWLWRLTLFAALACCAIGLLNSYSRGAWLGTALGLAWLAVQLRLLRPRSRPSSSKSGPLSYNSRPSRFACWLRRNAGPLSVVLLSVVILSFWQFRHTEFHPVRRAFSVGNKADFSWRNRVAAWEGSLAMMADRPLTGFGWNKPERIYDQYYRQPKVSEGMAIQLNHYFILGMSLGVPALICFAMYAGLCVVPLLGGERGGLGGSRFRSPDLNLTRNLNLARPQISSAPPSVLCPLSSVCRSAATVLLIGLWFDGGLFNLATASVFWVLLEVGRDTAPTQPSTTNHQPSDK